MKLRVVVLLLIVAASRSAHACSCGERPDARTVLPRAEAVVTGVVVGRHPVVIRGKELRYPAGFDVPMFYPVSRVDIAVTRVFKGSVNDQLELTELGCCVCEYQFEVGTEYLIFVHRHWDMPERQMASFCWPTKPVASAASDLENLGKPIRTYQRRTDVRSNWRELLDAGHVLATWSLRRWPVVPVGIREHREVIKWAVATFVLALGLMATLARSRRSGPRV